MMTDLKNWKLLMSCLLFVPQNSLCLNIVLRDKGLEEDEEVVPWVIVFELICCSSATAVINRLNKIVIIIMRTQIQWLFQMQIVLSRAAEDYSSNLFLCTDYAFIQHNRRNYHHSYSHSFYDCKPYL